MLLKQRGGRVAKNVTDDSLVEIEETQAALRTCIAQARELAEDSERLVRKHRAQAAETKPPNPAR